MSDIADDNLWLNNNNQVVFEMNGGGSPHYFRPDGSEVDPRSGQIRGDADRFAFLDIKGLQLNSYIDQFKLPDGNFAMTFVQYDNSELQPFDQLLLQYILFPAGPHDEPLSIYRHSNTYKFVQQDGHGNRVDENFVDGRLRDSTYTYSDGTSVLDQFDAKGDLTLHETTGPGGLTQWTPNGDGTWTRAGSIGSTILATTEALQQIANDSAAHWGKGPTVAANGGQLVLLSGGLLINDNFQAIISNDGASLMGQDTAAIVSRDGAGLVTDNGSGLISLQADSIISRDGAGLVDTSIDSLITNDGGSFSGIDTIISNDGASFAEQFSAAFNPSGNTVGTRLVNALVFADTNFNGKFDKGEPWTITDADGHYSLAAGSGPLTLLGGTDAGTNLPFKGAMEAPVGSSIISPLTTLTTELWKQVGSLEISLNTVDQAFGLSGVDLTKLDPVAGIQNGDATSAAVYVAGAKVFDTITLMAGTLNGMGADNLGAEKAIVQAMVGDLAHGGALNLEDKATVAALFTTAASTLGIDGSAIAASIAGIVVSTNQQLDSKLAGGSVGQGLLDALAAVETNVQGTITGDLHAAAGDPGKIADVASGAGSAPPDQTPPAHSGPPHWMASVDAGAHPAGWSPAGIGDFNHDATSDLAWLNPATGGIDIWQLANGHWSASSDVGTHPAGYQPALMADFNHDGTSDIGWYNAATHDFDLWKIANGKWAGSVDIGTHPAGYTPALSGDFNADGTRDIAWYNPANGDIDIWKIDNGHWAGSVDAGSHPAGYTPALAGDFNGDGTSDIAWFNPASGDLDIWKLADGKWAGSVDVGSHPAGYRPLGAADFNGDGTSDIAWYNPATNDIDVWLIQNGHWAGSVDIGTHPAGSVALGVGDVDHTGTPDILWQNTQTGQIENWLLATG